MLSHLLIEIAVRIIMELILITMKIIFLKYQKSKK